MIKVLFVCAGNICRSPMAEGVFQQLVDQAGLTDRFEIDSAGTGPWHVGESAHRGTLDVLRRQGIDYRGRARQLRAADLTQFDFVLVADRENLSFVRRMLADTSAQVKLFLSYAHDVGTVKTDEVPDPYYVGNFDQVHGLVQRGAEALLAHIRETHDL
jgi:protein-tyrosine phosphatase